MIAYECPTCHARVTYARPEDAPYRPFCSERCKLIDLGRWLNEEFRISEERTEPEAADEPLDGDPGAAPPPPADS